MLMARLSIQAPGRIGMSMIGLGRDENRLAATDRAQHGDPVEQLTADIAGLREPGRRRLRDESADAGLLKMVLHAFGPFRVGRTGALAQRDAGTADLERAAAA